MQTIPNLSHITIGTTITEKSNFCRCDNIWGQQNEKRELQKKLQNPEI